VKKTARGMVREMRVPIVVGAGPQFIEAAVDSRARDAVRNTSGKQESLREVLVHTGRYYDEKMSAVFFRELEILPSVFTAKPTGCMLERVM